MLTWLTQNTKRLLNPLINLKDSASSLSGKRRRVLLLQPWWEDRIVRGIATYGRQAGWVWDFDMRWTNRLPPQPWDGDGIIVFAGGDRAIIDFVRSAKVPVVDLENYTDVFGAPKVIGADFEIGRVAADHLIEAGFRHLGYVSDGFEPAETPGARPVLRSPVARERLRGFEAAARKVGAECIAIPLGSFPHMLKDLPRPLGLYAEHDGYAITVLQICWSHGIRVPEEIALVGSDDTEVLCDCAMVPLSSVNCDFERKGYEAAALLDRMINGQPPPTEPVVVTPRGVTKRRSSDTVAIPDRDAAIAMHFIRENYKKPVSISDVVDIVDKSLRYVQRVFKEHVGHTMLEELNRLRTLHATTLLADPRLKLDEVASRSGFSSRFHLTRAFARNMGTTPQEWRRKLREQQMGQNHSGFIAPESGD